MAIFVFISDCMNSNGLSKGSFKYIITPLRRKLKACPRPLTNLCKKTVQKALDWVGGSGTAKKGVMIYLNGP